MAQYTHCTYLQAKNFLASRLGDTSKVRWSDLELGAHVIESLRMWAIASLYFRDRGFFDTVNGTDFYDPTLLAADGLGDLILPKTVTDLELLTSIQRHLLETVSTEMFSTSEIVSALQRRRNQFLLDTGQILTVTKRTLPSPPVDRFSLPDSTIAVQRVVYIGMTGAVETSYSTLWEADEFQLNAFLVNWSSTPAEPQVYTVALIPETGVRLAPPTLDLGKLHLTTIDSGINLDGTGVLMGVLDDYAPIIKWGALADLLGKDGMATDPQRSAYCEQRYQEGVELAKLSPTVLNAEINGAQASLASVFDLDSGAPGWQLSSDQPETVALAGSNQLALYPVPDGIYSISLDLVRNAIIPTLDGDFLQIGREYLDIILDYAQHLACFKEGWNEIQATQPHFDRLMKAAAGYNSRLLKNASKFESLRDRTEKESFQRGKNVSA